MTAEKKQPPELLRKELDEKNDNARIAQQHSAPIVDADIMYPVYRNRM
jgi:hypothetical protein